MGQLAGDHQHRAPSGARREDSGDGWSVGPDGQKFWGLYGAAGLLLVNSLGQILLQHRVHWSHFGGTWGIPGGARHRSEAAPAAAVREAREEAGVVENALEFQFVSVLDLGWWSYSTVAARATEDFSPSVMDAESVEVEWVDQDDVEGRPLHPGFAASWPTLRGELRRRPRVIVDAANVVGSRPDGWWSDRREAARQLVRRLDEACAAGLSAELLGLPLARWWPQVTVVLEGQAAGVSGVETLADIVRATGSGDDAIVEEARRVGSAGDDVVVVTSDRELAARVTELGAHVVSSGRFRDVLDQPAIA